MFENKYLKFALHKFSRAVAIQLLSSTDYPDYNGDGIKILKDTPFDLFFDNDGGMFLQIPIDKAKPSKVRVIEFDSNQARDIWVSKFKQALAEMDKI